MNDLKYGFFYTVALGIDSLVEMFFNCFLLYMALRFSRINKNVETDDPILGRKVPTLVFL